MTIEDLAAFGADTQDGMKRCMNNESFYLRLVKMIPNDANFGKLYDAVESGNLDAAFEAAHAIKGAAGNLSLTPIVEPASEITELLRARTQMDYSPLTEKIRKAQEELTKLCAE